MKKCCEIVNVQAKREVTGRDVAGAASVEALWLSSLSGVLVRSPVRGHIAVTSLLWLIGTI